MNNYLRSIFICMLFLFAGKETIAQSKDERAVASAVEEFRKAMVDGDKTALEKLTFNDLSYGHSAGKVENKASFIESLTSGKSDFVAIELNDQTIKVHDKTAIVRHTFIAKTNDGGNPGSVKLAILTVWQKEKKQWKLLARQAVKLP